MRSMIWSAAIISPVLRPLMAWVAGLLVAAKDDIVSLWPGNRERYRKLLDGGVFVVAVGRRVCRSGRALRDAHSLVRGRRVFRKPA